MRLDELLTTGRRGRPWAHISNDTGDLVSAPRLAALAKPGEVLAGISRDTVTGIARAYDIPERTVWLACGESLGIPELFVMGKESEARAMLADGWHDLDPARAALLRTFTGILVAGQQADSRVTDLEAENARLWAARVSPQRARA